MGDYRTCGHRFWLSGCQSCNKELTRRRMARKASETREAAKQQAPEPGGPTLGEIRRANQERIARERSST